MEKTMVPTNKTIYLYTNASTYNEWITNYNCTNVEIVPDDNWHQDEVFIKCTGEENEMKRLALNYSNNIYCNDTNVKELFNQIWAGNKVSAL